ncbi:MAG: Peptidase M23 [Candidatus Amesbacteria bacterium GW2011_GWB1_47_19]|nr:MAG: Peptidase M23 [Candidatus Amesbacteria bacterium GW2011_GWA1_44_24]KKU32097.1 MAG: Peptidase M23 family protein [Candidatus Amesbacteria bacterium GW2011_GWC1_46_24]KKU67781.1 MAG: Peptidase M23 [Candidatus Amesbacteria bacterium GW2011_GWB1_47_19]
MVNKNWKIWVFRKAVPVLKKQATPLPVKELAFRAIRFAVTCGRSHPVSFALRPVLGHRQLRSALGLGIAVGAVVMAVYGPLPAGAGDLGGPVSLADMTVSAEVSLTTKTGVRLPLDVYGISQKYWLLHSGIDMRAPLGEPIHPIMSGKVMKVEKEWFGYGNMVVITHGAEYQSLYGHLSKILVREGQVVTTGTIIGEVGSTGRSTGPHLHLEILENGRTVNPATILGIKL